MSKPSKVEPPEFDISALISNGVPVQTAVFHRTVQSFGANGIVGEPETAFYDARSKAKASRTAEMYYTPHGLICVQKYGTLIIPLPNVSFVRLK